MNWVPVSALLLLVPILAFALKQAWRATRRGRALTQLRSGLAEPHIRLDGAVPALFPRLLSEAGLAHHPARSCWLGWQAGVLVAIGGGAVLAGGSGALLFGLLALAIPPAVLWSLRDRGSFLYDAGVPALLDDVAASLRSGSSVLGAMTEAVGRTRGELAGDVRHLVDSVNRGAEFEQELHRWSERRNLSSVQLGSAALAVAVSVGGRQADAVETVAVSLRERDAVRQEARSLGTQSRASASVMAVVPLVFTGAAALLDPRVATLLLHTQLGLACLVGGLVLDGASALWMARITRSAW